MPGADPPNVEIVHHRISVLDRFANFRKTIRASFIVGISVQVLISLLGDRDTYKPGVLRKSWKRFKASPLVSRELWDTLREYDREGFHPDDRDTTELVATWRARLFGDEGTLNDKLATRSAA